MMKLLIVEDDKLVRMGLVAAVPWESYGMKVVGEARNGQEALEFLERSEADCVITDLEMPKMSGIELMQIVRKRYPALLVVVLTLHKDFEYVQEALRLGAIDYIAKVQLEKEQFEEVLERLQRLIREHRRARLTAPDFDFRSEAFPTNVGYALLTLEEHGDLQWMERGALLPASECYEVGESIWFWLPRGEDNDEEKAASIAETLRSRSGWTLFKIEGLTAAKPMELYRSLRKYRQKAFFYEYDADNVCVAATPRSFGPACGCWSEAEFEALRKRWVSLDWVLNEALFCKLRRDLAQLRPASEKLHLLLYEVASAWNRRYGSAADASELQVAPMQSWQETERWLVQARERAAVLTVKMPYSQEVVNCITKAASIVQEEYCRPLFAVHVAKRVNMSRSYFNQCFKDIIGSSFNEYLSGVRLEKARNYLLHTHKPIQWIAERTGYADEKYFSRVFRRHMSMTPKEYRRAYGNRVDN